MTERISVAPFREAFERSNMSYADLSRRMGLKGDTSAVQRMLGLRIEIKGGRKMRQRTHINYDTAVRLCRALDLDPHEVGL